MQTFGDLALVASIIIALIFVPPYLWKQYGGPPVGAWLARGLVNSYQFIMSCLTYRPIADQADGRTDGPSVPQDDLYCPRLESDISKQAAIEVMLYNGWGTADIRSILKGSNETLGLEVEAARQRLGIEAPDSKTPIAQRPTSAKFAPR